jgi:beta-aspartyl-peptidase (threonine type)
MTTKNFGILIHGGASGSNKRRITKQYSNRGQGRIAKAIEQAACCGFDILKNVNTNESSTALNAVEIAVTSMENSGVFDAGIVGSYLTMDSEIEMDASIMNGKDLTAGSVGAVKDIQNPIKLARLVMERTDHIMVVSDGATQLAKLFGIEIKYRKPSKQNLKKYNNYIRNNKNKRAIKDEWPKNYKIFSSLPRFMPYHFGTVGAVAIDKQGNVASAVSTGGRWFKMHGRVGDSAIIGSGLYADNESGAACTTGVGELIIRLCLAKTACDYMRAEQDVLTSSTRAIELLTRKFGKNTGGIIVVNKHGEFGMETNTRSMPIALFTNKTGDRPKVALSKHEAASLFI